MGSIYKIMNLMNRKCYIGQTFHPIEKRWHAHKTGKGSKAVYGAIQMYGLEAFTCEVLHDGITDRGVLNVLEIALIEAHDAYRNGYNQHPGGQDEYRYSDAWEHAETICRLYREELMPVQRIADQFSTAKGTILAILEANGIERRDKSYAWEHAQQICHLYTKRNKSTLAIADLFDVSRKTIDNILRKNGINMRDKNRRKGQIWEHTDEICRLYTEELLSHQKIADRFGTSRMQIRRILEDCGIELRKYSPRNRPNSYQLRLDF